MIATAFWHATGPWVYLSYALAALCVWIATSTIPPHWRQMLLAAMAIGVVATWTLPQFWTEPEKIAWREILIPGDADPMR